MNTLSADTNLAVDTLAEANDNETVNVSAPTDEGMIDPPAYMYRSKLTEFLWTLPQPIIALTMMSAVAIAITSKAMSPEALGEDADLLTAFLLFSPLFFILAAERIWTKKKAWLLKRPPDCCLYQLRI